MDIISTNWGNIYAKFIIWGIIIFLLFRFIRFGLNLIIKNKKLNNSIQKFLPATELGVWIFFFARFMFVFAEARSLFAFVVLAVLLSLLYLLIRFWIIDLVAGVFVKSKNNYVEGDILQVEDFHGVIKKFGNRTIELETKDEKTIYVPYRKIAASVNIKSESIKQTSGFTFQIETNKTEELNKLLQEFNSYIISLPWSSVEKSPIVSLLKQTDSTFVFNITIYPVDKKYSTKYENTIREKFEVNK